MHRITERLASRVKGLTAVFWGLLSTNPAPAPAVRRFSGDAFATAAKSLWTAAKTWVLQKTDRPIRKGPTRPVAAGRNTIAASSSTVAEARRRPRLAAVTNTPLSLPDTNSANLLVHPWRSRSSAGSIRF